VVNSIGDATKKRLKSVVLELRRLLEDDLARELKRLGVDSARDVAIPVSKLSYLTDREQAIREAIDAALAKEQALAGSFAAAVEGLRREAAYTHLNRLVGLKSLELRGHLVIDGEPTEAVTCRPEYSDRPKWLWTLRDRDSRYRYGEEAEELLWREGLTRACEAVTAEIHLLFDPADPYAQVWPSHKTLRAVVARLNQLPEDLYCTDELLGWVYQHFQSEEKQLVTAGNSFTQSLLNTNKYVDPDVATYTALYTERYMVDFLLQNSLGARWMEMYPDAPVKASWQYYVTPATPHTRPPKPLKDWTILDPCVGSGHFLVVTFDLLVRLYAKERRLAESGRIPREWTVPEPEVARTIVERNLFGIDIDSRAVQIAALALYLKAKEHGFDPTDRPPRLNLVAADAVLTRGTAYEALLAQYKQDSAACEAIDAIWHALGHVRDLGSLVRVEEEVEAAVRKAKIKEDRHSPLLSSAKDWDSYKQTLFNRLLTAFEAEAQSSDVTARIFGREGEKGVGLVEPLSRRYDVVCTNPPYLGSRNMGPMLKAFVAKNYASGKRDLYAAFILRCRERAVEDGYVAMVTQQSWMFLRSYADLRAVQGEHSAAESTSDKNGQAHGPSPRKGKLRKFNGLLRETSIETLAHLGPGAFAEISGEVVNIALFTLRNTPPPPEHQMTAFRLTGLSLPEPKAEVLRRAQRHRELGVKSSPKQWDLLPIPGAPLVYWLRPRFFELLQSLYRLRDIAEVRQGLATTDNNRFVRCFWEVSDFGVVRDGKPVSGRWFWYAKGGRYQKWAGLEWLVVDWEQSGKAIKEFVVTLSGTTHWSRRVASESYYFHTGLTYTSIARGSFGVRILISAIFGHKANLIVTTKGTDTETAAQLNSCTISFLLRSVSQAIGFEVSHVQALPIVRDSSKELSLAGKTCVALKRCLVMQDVSEKIFIGSGLEEVTGFPLTKRSQEAEREGQAIQGILHAVEGVNERLICDTYALDQSDMRAVLEETGMPAGWRSLITGYDTLPELPTELPPISRDRSRADRGVEARRYLGSAEIDDTGALVRTRLLQTARLTVQEKTYCLASHQPERHLPDHRVLPHIRQGPPDVVARPLCS
jgi:hypothetical protein